MLHGVLLFGVRPMPVAEWASRTPPPFDHYAVLGLPMEALEPLLRKLERETPEPKRPARKAPLKGCILV